MRRLIRLIKRLWSEFTHAFTGWAGIALASLLGVVLGVGVYTLQYSGVTGYLGNDPQTCANWGVSLSVVAIPAGAAGRGGWGSSRV